MFNDRCFKDIHWTSRSHFNAISLHKSVAISIKKHYWLIRVDGCFNPGFVNRIDHINFYRRESVKLLVPDALITAFQQPLVSYE